MRNTYHLLAGACVLAFTEGLAIAPYPVSTPMANASALSEVRVRFLDEPDAIPKSTRAEAVQILKHKWVYLIGDSSLRMFYGALIATLNGTLADPRFGSYELHDKGGCQGHIERESDQGMGCLREYFDPENKIRITYSFKTMAQQHVTAMDTLISSRQIPDVFLLTTGPWDLTYKTHNGTNLDVTPAVKQAVRWVMDMRTKFPISLLSFATLVACDDMRKKAVNFNKLIRRALPWDDRLLCLDRHSSTMLIPGKCSKQKIAERRCQCAGWHAFNGIVLKHMTTWLGSVQARFGANSSNVSAGGLNALSRYDSYPNGGPVMRWAVGANQNYTYVRRTSTDLGRPPRKSNRHKHSGRKPR
jgi:hypothetical protein